jgi:hypothetical protein
MAKKKSFQVGDIVRHTGKWLRSVGLQRGAPINGKVVGFTKMGTGRMFPVVQWSDAPEGETTPVAPDNIEHDPRHRRKNPRANPAPRAAKLRELSKI